jgi:hypothetical protein
MSTPSPEQEAAVLEHMLREFGEPFTPEDKAAFIAMLKDDRPLTKAEAEWVDRKVNEAGPVQYERGILAEARAECERLFPDQHRPWLVFLDRLPKPLFLRRSARAAGSQQ